MSDLPHPDNAPPDMALPFFSDILNLHDHIINDDDDDDDRSFSSQDADDVLEFAVKKVWPGAEPRWIEVKSLNDFPISWHLFALGKGIDEDFVLRILKKNGPAATIADSHRFFVAANTFARDIIGLPIPEIVMFDYTDDNDLQKPYILQKMVRGLPLSRVQHTMTHADKCQLARELGDHCKKMLNASSSMPGEIVLPDDLRPGAFHVQEIRANCLLPPEIARAVVPDLSGARPFDDVEDEAPIYPYSKIMHCMLAEHSIMGGQAYRRSWRRERPDPAHTHTLGGESEDEDDEELEASFRQLRLGPVARFERRFFDEDDRGMFDDMDQQNPHRVIFREEQDIFDALAQVIIRLDEEGYLGLDRYALMGVNLHEDDIIVDIRRPAGAPLITAFMGINGFSFAPKFNACKPPLSLWCTEDFGSTNTQSEKKAAKMPTNAQDREIRNIFDAAAGPEFVEMAYDAKYRIARCLYNFCWFGLESDHGQIIDANSLLREAAEVLEDLELPAFF